MELNDLRERFNRKDNTDEDWLQLEKDAVQFMKEEHPIEEKRMVSPLGILEGLGMICDGIRLKRQAETSESEA